MNGDIFLLRKHKGRARHVFIDDIWFIKIRGL